MMKVLKAAFWKLWARLKNQKEWSKYPMWLSLGAILRVEALISLIRLLLETTAIRL